MVNYSACENHDSYTDFSMKIYTALDSSVNKTKGFINIIKRNNLYQKYKNNNYKRQRQHVIHRDNNCQH
jgi:hypothetical protein